MERLFRVGEFAALTGVSIRTLHHYDRIGLLRPSDYTEGRQRQYARHDLLRLQQILTLRYLGFSLREIGQLLDRADFDLLASLQIQRGALRDRRTELARVEADLDALIEHRQTTGRWAWELVAQASASVQHDLTQRGEKVKEYYTADQLKQFEELGRPISPEERQAIERQWSEVIAAVRANRDLDPASPVVQALANRWTDLVEATFRGNRDLMAAVGQNYQQGRFADNPDLPTPEDFAFIERANQIRRERTAD